MRSTTDMVSLSFSLIFLSSLHTHAPHPSQQYHWLSVVTDDEINDRRGLSLSLSLSPFSLISPYPCPSPISAVSSAICYHRRWGQRSTQSLSFSPFFPSFFLSLSRLPIFIVCYTNHHQPSPISTIPLWRPLLPSFLLPIIDSHLSPPILASPHLLSICHLWSSFSCSHDYHHYSSSLFLSQASTTAPQHTATNYVFSCGEATRKKN